MAQNTQKLNSVSTSVQLFHRLRQIVCRLSEPRIYGMRPRAIADLLRLVAAEMCALAADIEGGV